MALVAKAYDPILGLHVHTYMHVLIYTVLSILSADIFQQNNTRACRFCNAYMYTPNQL